MLVRLHAHALGEHLAHSSAKRLCTSCLRSAVAAARRPSCMHNPVHALVERGGVADDAGTLRDHGPCGAPPRHEEAQPHRSLGAQLDARSTTGCRGPNRVICAERSVESRQKVVGDGTFDRNLDTDYMGVPDLTSFETGPVFLT